MLMFSTSTTPGIQVGEVVVYYTRCYNTHY